MKARKVVPTCAFCAETVGLAVCTWKDAAAMVRATYGELRIGDRVKRATGKTIRPAAVVLQMELMPMGFISVALGIKDREKHIMVHVNSPVRVERPGVCRVWCCERHRAERGAGAVHCCQHWRDWERVA